MAPGNPRPSIIQGHTIEDKMRSVEAHLNDLYRMKGSMARPEPKRFPIVLPAYGESALRTRDKIYSIFATHHMRLRGAMVAIDTPHTDKVYLEMEIIRVSGLVDSFARLMGEGMSDLPLRDIELEPRDLINIYMTYTPADVAASTKAGVTATIYGDTLA